HRDLARLTHEGEISRHSRRGAGLSADLHRHLRQGGLRQTRPRLYPVRLDLHSLPRTFAGYRDIRGPSPLPAASDADRRASAEHQRLGCGAALLLHRDPRPTRDHSMAYVLLCALRQIALPDTEFADATCGTIRLKLLKVGALVRISVRRIR